MIKADNLNMSFGNVPLFDSVEFNINKKEKIGLVGRNGSGKTTLFNLLSGNTDPEHGEIIIPKNYKIGLVKQELDFSCETVLEEAKLGLSTAHKDDSWRAAKILSGLGFSEDDMKQKPEVMSGGYQIRLNLTKVIVSEPGLLLLDEPTNYLDIISIRWLVQYLKSWRKELMLITHDRGFMDQVVTHTMIIHRQKIKKIKGNTGKMYEQIAAEEETYEKTRVNDDKKRKEIEVFINRFRSKARLANSVQSRVKSLKKRIQLKKLEKIEDLNFSFAFSSLNAKHLMEIKELSFDYNKSAKELLIDDFNYTVNNRDRICIMGKNGKGKTTLLRILAGELPPLHGDIKGCSKLSVGIYDQLGIEKLNKSHTVEEEILFSGGDGFIRQKERDICGAMMFSGDQALKKIQVLSGGEKSRVLLGKILVSPCNMLLLDEPTNHLDMESCDALMCAIDNFPGAVIIVTHNELFLKAIAKRLIVFDDNKISIFENSYREFLEKTGWQDEVRMNTLRVKKDKDVTVNKKELRKQRAEKLKDRADRSRPLEKKINSLEKEITKLEIELHKANQDLVEAASLGKGARINQLSKMNHELKIKIKQLYHDLNKYTEELEQL